jgi:hypothetical protein
MINKKLLFLIVGLLMTTQMIYSQVPSYVPSNGLVGYWPFNGDANDESGNGNNGTVNGATLTTDRFGNNNSAYSFDGVNNYISTNYSGILGTTDRSVSFWAKQSQIFNNSLCASCSRKTIISYGSNIMGPSQIGNGFYCEFNVGLTGISFDGNETTASYSTPFPVNDNNWHHYVYVMSSVTNSSSVKIYQDGILLNQLSYTYLPSAIINTLLGNNLEFGRRTFNQQNPTYYNGQLDDIGMWNRALTQQEITNMYNGVNYSDTCNAVSGSLVNGLVAYYPFCGNANDQSGNGNNGVVNGASLTTDRFGNINSAYDFDGISNYITVLDNNVFNMQSFTISTWVKNSSSAPTVLARYILNKGCNTPSPSFRLYYQNDGIQQEYVSDCWVPNRVYQNGPSSNNLWTNIIYSYDGQNLKMYVDGVLFGTANQSGSLTNNNNPIFIGCTNATNNCPQLSSFYAGKIDDIGIWNRALSQQEITQLFNQNQCTTNITVTDTLIINVGQLSYTNPVTYANNITIYPNPANTQVNISFNNITDLTGGNINIINSLGQQVATTPITLSGTNTTMPLNTWGGIGLYFVQILNAQGIVVDVKKIILQ